MVSPQRLRPLAGDRAFLALLLLCGCGGGGNGGSGLAQDPVVLTLSPSNAVAGTDSFVLTVEGSNFDASSRITWNDAAANTTYIGVSRLATLISAQQVAQVGTATVRVVDSAPGGGTSSAVVFTVLPAAPVPEIAVLAPAGVTAGAAGFTLAVTGSGFVATTAVRWNDQSLPTTYLGPSQLTAQVAAVDVSVAGTVTVTAENPPPDDATSAPVVFTVGSALATSAYVRQSASYSSFPGDVSESWRVELNDVLPGSAIYVVGTWPNFSSTYPSMQVADGSNDYAELKRYDDRTVFNLGIQGTQSVGHWYAPDVRAGSYSIHMSPTPGTFEDFVGLVAFEIAGVAPSALDGSTLAAQEHVAPGSDVLAATVTSVGANGLLVAITVNDVDATAPTAPLVGTGWTDAGPLWDFFGNGNASARAEYAIFDSAGAHVVLFGAAEGGAQLPDYVTMAAFFDSAVSGGGAQGARATTSPVLGGRHLAAVRSGAEVGGTAPPSAPRAAARGRSRRHADR